MKIITFHSAIPVFERLGKGMSGNGNADRSEKSFKAGGVGLPKNPKIKQRILPAIGKE